MIRKFVNRLDWTKFSSEAEVEVLTPEVIEAFKHKWDWHELSGNPNVPFTDELLEKYADFGIGTKLFVFGEILSMKIRVLTSTISFRSTFLLANSKIQVYATKWLSNRKRYSLILLSAKSFRPI